jgi:RNA polymerase sigma-70 factor (ECF subfamily)
VTQRVTKAATEFGALYRRYAPDVHRFALVLCGDRSEADDITSETFVRAWTSPEPIRAETVKGYLFTIARNVYREGRRKRARETPLGEGAHALSDPGRDPAERAASAAALDAVLARLRTLPAVDRAALLLHVQEGTPYREIARVLGLSLPTVKIRIHRARLALAAVREG